MAWPSERWQKENKELKTILSASVKGGVGKTTVAVGLAQALQRRGHRVGILDLDYRAPCVPILLNAEEMSVGRTHNDGIIPPAVDGLWVFSMAYLWPPNKCVQVEDSDATDDVAQLLAPGVIVWPDLDFLVLDTPPTSSGIVRVALESSGASGAVIITHPSRVSRADTLRTLDLFSEKQVPVYALVSNQGTDEEGRQRYDLLDSDIEHLAKQYNVPLFWTIPHTRDLAPHFDRLTEALLRTTPITLAPPAEPKGAGWQRLVELSTTLQKLS